MAGRSKRRVPDYSAWRQEVSLPRVSPLPFLGRDGFTDSFFTRMLYSCLVDADFLDTEAFMQGPQPRGEYASLPVLLERLSAKTYSWLTVSPGSALNRCHNDILRACMEHGAQWPLGFTP
ncbi:MAG: hypothetical protein LUD80_04895 [Clostridiales bacterium]|nr:hypothetical protein [Clostridiales bacterium]